MNSKQRWTHSELIQAGEDMGLECLDLIVMFQAGVPPLQNARQLHARKRHSYLLVMGRSYVFPTEDRPKRRVKPQRISVEEMLSWLE